MAARFRGTPEWSTDEEIIQFLVDGQAVDVYHEWDLDSVRIGATSLTLEFANHYRRDIPHAELVFQNVSRVSIERDPNLPAVQNDNREFADSFSTVHYMILTAGRVEASDFQIHFADLILRVSAKEVHSQWSPRGGSGVPPLTA